MSFDEFKKFFKERLDENNIKLEENQYEKFYNYMVNVLDWNTKINVTAVREEKEFIIKHFIDSLMISHYIKDNYKIIDIGTGGGFPGIPLKLYNENIKIT